MRLLKSKYLATLSILALLSVTVVYPVFAQQTPPQNGTPQSLLEGLKTNVREAEGYITLTNQQKDVLSKKIDTVAKMIDRGNFKGAVKKLERDIGPKLADPRPTPRTSWLAYYPDDPRLQGEVREFALLCQNLIQQIIFLISAPIE